MYKEFLQRPEGYTVPEQILHREELGPELALRSVHVLSCTSLSERYLPNEQQRSH